MGKRREWIGNKKLIRIGIIRNGKEEGTIVRCREGEEESAAGSSTRERESNRGRGRL